MDDLESKLNAVLANPQMMQQIMSLAQNLAPEQAPAQPEKVTESIPTGNMDLTKLQGLSALAGQATIDRNQQSLLRALSPYLSRTRLSKLERAMRAAKMAGLATTVLGGAFSGQGR